MRGRFRQSQRSRDRLKVSHLTYQDHVRSAEHRPQGVRERVRSRPSSRWLTMPSCGDGDADRSSIVIMQGRSELMVSNSCTRWWTFRCRSDRLDQSAVLLHISRRIGGRPSCSNVGYLVRSTECRADAAALFIDIHRNRPTPLTP